MEEIQTLIKSREAEFKDFLLGKQSETPDDIKIIDLLKKHTQHVSNNPADITTFLYENPVFTNQIEDLRDSRTIEQIMTDSPEDPKRVLMIKLLDKLMFRLLNKDFFFNPNTQLGGNEERIEFIKIENSFDPEFENYFNFNLVFNKTYYDAIIPSRTEDTKKHFVKSTDNPTHCASYFVAGDVVNLPAFDKYIFNMFYNLINFYILYPTGQCRYLLDIEGGMNTPFNTILQAYKDAGGYESISGEDLFKWDFFNYTKINRASPSQYHPGYDTILPQFHECLKALKQKNWSTTYATLFDFIYDNLCSISRLFPNSSIFIFTYERKDKTGNRIGINPRTDIDMSLTCEQQKQDSTLQAGYIGQSMRYLFFRQKTIEFKNIVIEPVGLGCCTDAHATGYTNFLKEEIDAFAYNYNAHALTQGIEYMYLITSPPSYSNSWHPHGDCPRISNDNCAVKIDNKRRGMLAGWFFGIGGKEKNQIMPDEDYALTLGKLFNDRYKREDNFGINCKFNYGNDENVLVYLMHKYKCAETNKHVIYMHGNFDFYEIGENNNNSSLIQAGILLRLYHHYKYRLDGIHGSHNQMKEIKKLMKSDDVVPLWMKIMANDAINSIYSLNNQYAANEKINHLYATLANLETFLGYKDAIIGFTFSELLQFYMNRVFTDFIEPHFKNYSMKTWCLKRPEFIEKFYLEPTPDHRLYLFNATYTIQEFEAKFNTYLKSIPKKYYDIDSIRNFSLDTYDDFYEPLLGGNNHTRKRKMRVIIRRKTNRRKTNRRKTIRRRSHKK